MLKKEFLDNVRNRWIIAISAIFIILTLVVSYFGAALTGGGTGFQGLSDTVIGMLSIEVFLVPILGLMLAYGTVVGEKERGSIHLLLSMPITRLETILGKFLGLMGVIMVSILTGLGIAGAIIMASAGTEGWENYVVLILGSMMFALAFLSIGLLLSTLAGRRSTTMGLAVFLWFFFVMIFDLILAGVYVAMGGTISFLPGETTLPDWYYAISIANPYDAFGYYTMSTFGFTGAFGYSYNFPSFVNVGTSALSMILWTVISLGISVWRFQRQDL
ncbi:MAG: ABC transporter permease subunit [Thermoplasmata archaeon]